MSRHISSRFVLLATAAPLLAGCADPSPTGDDGGPARSVVMINALEDGATIYLSGDVAPDSIAVGAARRLVDVRGTGFGPAPQGVIVATRVGGGFSTSWMPTWGANTAAIVVGRANTPRVATASDTLGPRSDVANIRLAFTAEDAPLVRGFVLPASQALEGSLNWVSTQSPYTAPLVTTFYRGVPQSYRVHFTRYAPGSSEPLLAATAPFTVAAGEAYTILFGKSGSGYEARAVREPN